MSTSPENAVVRTEIPVSDLARSSLFYEAVTGWPLSPESAESAPMATFAVQDLQTGVSGNLYPEGSKGHTVLGPTVHFAVRGTLEEAAERCRNAGGTVTGSIVTIEGGRYQYATDLDGNSIGLYEPVV